MANAIRAGVGGWTYPPWRGTFYPPGLAQKRELDHAVHALTAIEINGTYYGGFKPAIWSGWAEAAPPGFVYAVKASRYCINRKLLADGADSVARFLGQGLTLLGDKLGPILWQFMATKTYDPDDFAGFLALLPKERDGVRLRHALEVRHDSFRDPRFVDQARAAGAAIVFADSDEFPRIDEDTADFRYARLMRCREEEPTGYDAAALDGWADMARTWGQAGDAYLFFISGAKVRAPAAAQALIGRVGRP